MSRILICVSTLLGMVLPAQAQSKDDSLPAGVLARLGKVRYRNVGRVHAIAFSPDGKTLLAGAWDGSIRLWDVAKGKELRQYPGHRGWVRSVAFAPDGKTFASAGKDKIIRLWDTATGKEIRRFEGHQNWIQAIAFSPDGKTLASCATRRSIRLWDTASGREVRRFDLNQHANSFIAFSPDNRYFAYPRDVHAITLLDRATGKEVQRGTGQRFWFRDALFSPDGTILAAISGFGAAPLLLWDTDSGKTLRPLANLEGTVLGLAFSPDRRTLATADDNHSLRIWEMATRQERCRFPSPDKQPCVLAFSLDGRILAQGSDDIAVLLWDGAGLGGKNRPQAAPLSPKELQALWNELAQADAASARRAIRRLVAGSKDSVPFIQEHLRPVSAVDERTLAQLIADLDSDRFETRDRATQQMEELAEQAESALRRALCCNPPLERRKRIDRLLERVAGERDNPSPDRLRMRRAVEALEYMDTPPARRALEELAKGATTAALTKEARAALDRLAKRP